MSFAGRHAAKRVVSCITGGNNNYYSLFRKQFDNIGRVKPRKMLYKKKIICIFMLHKNLYIYIMYLFEYILYIRMLYIIYTDIYTHIIKQA